MAYGDYDGPVKADKGKDGGACNCTRCQDSPAIWYNHGSHAWYCTSCRRDIQFDSFNLREWQENWLPKNGHPMFETREMITARVVSGPCTKCRFPRSSENTLRP